MSLIDYFRPKTKEKLMRGEHVHWVESNSRSGYIRQCVLSFPPWVNRKELEAIWQECRRLESVHGVPYTLDHIVPINHPFVSGLSVPWNLRPCPRKANESKGNKWHPDQLELFV